MPTANPISPAKQFLLVIGLSLTLWCVLFIGLNKGLSVDSDETQAALASMTVAEKKQRFLSLLLPAINTVHAQLQADYQWVKDQANNPNSGQAKKLTHLRKHYKVESNDQLASALKPHPQSIALAQAASESAWATSRFFREANNVFGVWSFNSDEPRLAALKKRGSKTIYLKKYSSVEASVRDYYLTIARGRVYAKFRQQRLI